MRLLLVGLITMCFTYGHVLAQEVKITGFTNLGLGNWSGVGDLQAQDTLCVFNLGNADYRIRATGVGLGGSFELNGTSDDIPFALEFRDIGSFVPLTAGVFEEFTGADDSDDTCGGVDNAEIKIIVDDVDLSGASSGNYSGTLTILLETQ